MAAVSLVVLSPTREGSVCDIQLVIMAMVLRTTPILSKGTDMSARGGAGHPSFCTGTGLHAAGDGLYQPPGRRHRRSPPAHRPPPPPRRGPARRWRWCCRCLVPVSPVPERGCRPEPAAAGAPQPERSGASGCRRRDGTGEGGEGGAGGAGGRELPGSRSDCG